MKPTKRKIVTAAERHRNQAAAAMPDVKRLVKKFGRRAVGNCLGKIKEAEKAVAELAALKKLVADKERRLK